jgi:hypothetical protein
MFSRSHDSFGDNLSCSRQHLQHDPDQLAESRGPDRHRGLGHRLHHLRLWRPQRVHRPLAQDQARKVLSEASTQH